MNALEAALTTAIAAAVDPVGVYSHPAPQGTSVPVVTFQKQASPAPARTFGPGAGEIQWLTFVYYVRAIAAEHKQPAGVIHEQIKAALDGADLQVDGFGTMLCRYEGDLDYSESVGGETYHHVGALYRIQLTP